MSADDAIELRKALDQNEIVPFFQPLVELRSGTLRGFEVLARWKHPTRGMVFPHEFIPLAESTGLNGLLTGNLLRAVFTAAKEIPEHLTLSVNISLTQLTDRTLPRHIRHAAEHANFPLNRLILEITETALIANTEHAYFIAHELKEQGARLALDDFGTGYSSLRHLQALPFDELKIDASFIRSMTHTRESRKITAAIIGLGNSLDLVTVAEGIENQTHADMLLWLGCELGQGWLYGRPVPAHELPALAINSKYPACSSQASPHTDPSTLGQEALPTQRLAQLHAIYDGVPVGLAFLDRNLRYVSINKRLADMNHRSVADHLGRTVAEVIPHVYSQVEPSLRRALAGEPSTGIEIREPSLTRPGQFNTFYVSYHPARDEADEVVGLSVSVIDITRRKQAEEALAESEDHYRHAVELSPQIPWTASPDGLILDHTQKAELFSGLTREETLGTGWLRTLHPDDLDKTVVSWTQCLHTGEPLDVEYRMRNHDGVWNWMRARAAARRDAEGNIVRWYGTLEDIDDHKKAIAALRHSEACLQAVCDTVPIGILIAQAPDGHIIRSNPRADNILRRTGTSLANFASNDTCTARRTDGIPLQTDQLPLARAILHGETSTEEIVYQRRDGTDVRIRLTAAPICTPEDTITGGVLAIEDLSQTSAASIEPTSSRDAKSQPLEIARKSSS